MAGRRTYTVAMTMALVAVVCAGCAHQEGVAAPRVVPADATTRPGLDGKDAKPITVRAQDIPEKVQILGVLGQPLGSLVTIRGKWMRPGGIPHDPLPRLHVSLINGKEPEQSVELHDMQVRSYWGKKGRGPREGENWDWRVDLWSGTEAPPSATEGETWELMGFETGSFESSSEEVWVEMGRPLLPAKPYWMWGFATRFEFIAVRKIR